MSSTGLNTETKFFRVVYMEMQAHYVNLKSAEFLFLNDYGMPVWLELPLEFVVEHECIVKQTKEGLTLLSPSWGAPGAIIIDGNTMHRLHELYRIVGTEYVPKRQVIGRFSTGM